MYIISVSRHSKSFKIFVLTAAICLLSICSMLLVHQFNINKAVNNTIDRSKEVQIKFRDTDIEKLAVWQYIEEYYVF